MTAVIAPPAQGLADGRGRARRARAVSRQVGWAVLGWVVGIAFF